MITQTIAAVAAAGALAASTPMSSDDDLSRMRGAVRIDGSSTVYPITEAVAEAFGEEAPRVRVTVGISGTGGGFKRFTVGETDISDASRPIKDKENKAAKQNGVEYIEIPVAYDGLTIVVNKENYWAKEFTVDDLKKIFLDGQNTKSWSDIRSEWPNIPMKIFSPGTDSGTFDYFKEVVAGKTGSIRSDMSVSEDDNVLVRGVMGEPGAIGFFGCAYYFENKERLKAVPVVNPSTKKAILPSSKTIESGDYAPFSRPLFIYVSNNSLSDKRPEVEAFVKFYLDNAAELAEEVGYVRLPKSVYDAARSNFMKRKTGTQFLKNGEKVHGPVTTVYTAK